MKTLRFISTFVMLSLASIMTVGSMYATASAAAEQESTQFNVDSPAAKPSQDSLVPEVGATIPVPEPALDKSKILRDQQSHVILDEKGGFAGQLSTLRNSDGEQVPAADLTVRIAHHGAIIGTTKTDANGRFSFTDMPEGVVAISAEGKDTLMMFSFVLFGHDTSIPENAGLLAAHLELDMDSAVVAGRDIATVKELLASSPNFVDKRFADEATALDQDFGYGTGETAVTLQTRRVQLGNDGTLTGEMNLLDERTGRIREVLDLTVHFVRNGVKVASSKVANNGSFVANGLTPGIHSVVVTGQDGAAAFAVDIVGTTYEDKSVRKINARGFTPARAIATTLVLAGGCGGSPVGPNNLNAFSGGTNNGSGNQAALLPPARPAPAGGAAGGGSGGGFGGGGGGGGIGGGGGGLGGLLLGGAALAAGYAAGRNSKNNNASSPSN